MRLVNTTPIPARCFVGPGDGGSRIGLLVAKATFELRPGEAPRLSLDRVDVDLEIAAAGSSIAGSDRT